MAQLKNTTINDIGFLGLPAGTTAQRPTPGAGQMRFNTSTGKAEFYNATQAAWKPTIDQGVIATGGTIYDVDTEGTTYRVHVFTNIGNTTFTVTQGGSVDYLIIGPGGGGGGGFNNDAAGGGGGAGAFITGTTTVSPQNYTITVGAGGAGGDGSQADGGDNFRTTPGNDDGKNGGDTSAFGLTANGGGGGTTYEDAVGFSNGNASGGGNGGAGDLAGNAGTTRSSGGQFGNDGGLERGTGQSNGTTSCGGGGGAGFRGGDGTSASTGGAGGAGLSSNITGIQTFYCGGGGGGATFGSVAKGGLGGGGDSGAPTGNSGGNNGLSGTPNTGGGGGGASSGNAAVDGGAGGSGIVIVRYPLRQENPVTAVGQVVDDSLVLDLDFAKPTVYSGSGTTVSDSRLNGVTGTFTGSIIPKNIRTHRSALEFSGDSTNIVFSELSTNSNQFSNISWLNLQAIDSPNSTIGIHLDNGSAGYRVYQNATILGCWVRGSSGTPSTNADSTIPLNQNVQFAITLINSTLTFYINGVSIGGGAIAGTPNVMNNVVPYIGRYSGGNYSFDGELYRTKLYNFGLSGEDVLNDFNANRWRFGI